MVSRFLSLYVLLLFDRQLQGTGASTAIQNVTVSPQMQDVNIEEVFSITLNCTVDTDQPDNTTIEWTSNVRTEMALASGTGLSLELTQNTVDIAVGEQFTCTATLENVNMSDTAVVNIYTPVIVLELPTSTSPLLVGEIAIFSITVVSVPAPVITWHQLIVPNTFIPEDVVPDGDSINITLQTLDSTTWRSVLSLQVPERPDVLLELYFTTVDNGFDTFAMDPNNAAPLIRAVVQSVTVSPPAQDVNVDEVPNITLNCTVDTDRPASTTIQWISDAQSGVLASGTGTFLDLDLNTADLADQEVFNCTATLGTISAQFDIVNVIAYNSSSLFLGLEQGSYMVGEGAGAVSVCVEILAAPASTSLECEIVALLTTTDANAVDGEDFNGANLEATFAVGNTSLGDTACTSISIFDDDALECDQSFTVSLDSTTPCGVTISAQSVSAIVHIGDNDDATVSLLTVIPTEEGNSVLVSAFLSSVPAGGLECNVVVQLSATDGNKAVAGIDYITLNPFAITFAAGTLGDISEDIFIITADDTNFEGDHCFTVSIDSVTPPTVVLGTPSSVEVTLIDNEVATVSLEQASYGIGEGDGVLFVCVNLVFGSEVSESECDIVATLSTTDGTAAEGEDFTGIAVEVTFDRSGGRACSAFSIIDDDVVEGDHNFTVALSSVNPSGVTISVPSTAAVTIVDNDDFSSLVLGFEQGSYMVGEGAGAVHVCVEIMAMSASLESGIVAVLTTTDGAKAVDGEDFNGANLEATFEGGNIFPGDTACTSISIFDDDAFEGDHSFTVLLDSTTPSGITIFIPSASAIVHIGDNDDATVSLQMVPPTEEGNSVEVCADISSVPAGGLECDVVVQLSATDGNKALNGIDYITPNPFTITFGTDTVGGTSMCISIITVDDTNFEGDHCFTVSIGSATPPTVLFGTPSSVEVTLVDNEVATVSLEQASYTIGEGGGVLSVCVEVVFGSVSESECDIVATLSTTDGTAVTGEDFAGGAVETTFMVELASSGQTPCSAFLIIDDDMVEGDEGFIVALSSVNPSGTTISVPSTAVVTIVDNEGLCPDPGVPLNGGVVGTGNSIGDTAIYSCDPGFELIGNASAACTRVGANSTAFLPAAPECQPLCPNPGVPLNGGVVGTGNSIGDTAIYTCDLGFELIGSTSATCEQVDENSAVFSPAAPECRPLCPDPVILNGGVIGAGNSIGDTAIYTCDLGFELVGSASATCEQVNVNSAAFLPAAPECRPLCPDPVEPLNGGVTFTGNSIGDTAIYSCDLGFELIGSASATCGQVNAASAAFSPAAPECQPSPSTALFQLRLLRTGDCTAWVTDNPDEKGRDIISTVADAVEMMCSCGFAAANIQNHEFSCRSIENTVVFRAEIVYAGSFSAGDLVEFISDWVQGGASIVADGTRLDVDISCRTQLDSFLSEDCVPTDQGETLSTGPIVGGIVGGLFVLLIITSIIVVVILVRRRKLKTFSPTAEEIELSQGTIPVGINPAYGSSITKSSLPVPVSSNPAYGQLSSVAEESASPYEVPDPVENEGEHEYDVIPYHLPSSYLQ